MKKHKAEMTSEECIRAEEEAMKNALLGSAIEIERRLRQYSDGSVALIKPAIIALKAAHSIETEVIEKERRKRRDELEQKEAARYRDHKF